MFEYIQHFKNCSHIEFAANFRRAIKCQRSTASFVLLFVLCIATNSKSTSSKRFHRNWVIILQFQRIIQSWTNNSPTRIEHGSRIWSSKGFEQKNHFWNGECSCEKSLRKLYRSRMFIYFNFFISNRTFFWFNGKDIPNRTIPGSRSRIWKIVSKVLKITWKTPVQKCWVRSVYFHLPNAFFHISSPIFLFLSDIRMGNNEMEYLIKLKNGKVEVFSSKQAKYLFPKLVAKFLESRVSWQMPERAVRFSIGPSPQITPNPTGQPTGISCRFYFLFIFPCSFLSGLYFLASSLNISSLILFFNFRHHRHLAWNPILVEFWKRWIEICWTKRSSLNLCWTNHSIFGAHDSILSRFENDIKIFVHIWVICLQLHIQKSKSFNFFMQQKWNKTKKTTNEWFD